MLREYIAHWLRSFSDEISLMVPLSDLLVWHWMSSRSLQMGIFLLKMRSLNFESRFWYHHSCKVTKNSIAPEWENSEPLKLRFLTRYCQLCQNDILRCSFQRLMDSGVWRKNGQTVLGSQSDRETDTCRTWAIVAWVSKKKSKLPKIKVLAKNPLI